MRGMGWLRRFGRSPACMPESWRLLSVFPPLLLLLALVLWHVDIPYLDQWELVPLLEKTGNNSLSFGDLWAQHNEHRILIPKLIMLGLAKASAWDTRYELATTYVLALLLYGLLLAAVRRGASSGDDANTHWVIPLLSIFVFSLNQWENWFLGWQLQVLLAAVCILGALQCLLHATHRPVCLAGAILLAVVASCSFGTGVLVWPAGLAMLLLLVRNGRVKWLAAAWSLSAVLCLVVYLHGLDTAVSAPYGSIKPHLLTYPAYVLKYLGAPLINWDGGRAPLLDLDGALAAVAGGAGLCIWAFLAYRAWGIERGAFAFWVAVGVFAVGCAVSTAYARGGDPLGSAQATSSRYITLGSFLWYSIAGLSMHVSASWSRTGRWRTVAYALLAVFSLAASAHGAYTWSLRYPAYREAQQAVIEGRTDAPLHYLYPRPEALGPRIDYLKEHHLNVFAGTP